MENSNEINKLLKISGIFDIVISIAYLILGIFTVVLAIILEKEISNGDENGVIATIFLSIILIALVALMFIVSIIFFVLFAVNLGIGISSLKTYKQPIEMITKKRTGIKVSAILSIIFSLFLFIVFILSIIGAAQNVGTIIGMLIISLISFVITLVNFIIKIKVLKKSNPKNISIENN